MSSSKNSLCYEKWWSRQGKEVSLLILTWKVGINLVIIKMKKNFPCEQKTWKLEKENKVYIYQKWKLEKLGEKEDLIEWFTKHCLKVFT